MNWDDLRYILALHRGATITQAATSLGVARTTVSRRLRALEQGLDACLIDATLDGVHLTPAGLELVQIAQDIEGHVHRAQGRILGQNLDLHGPLRVTILDFIYHGLSDVFASFIQQHPHVELTIMVTDEIVSLHRREADVAIRLNNTPTESLIGRKLGHVHFAVYAHRDLVRRTGTRKDLGAYPWIHDDVRHGARWLDQWLAQHAPGARVALRQDDYAVRLTSVKAGLGACFLPCFQGDADADLVCLGHHLEDETRSLWALTLHELRANVRIRTFMEHVHSAFLEQPGLLAGDSVKS